MQISCTGADFRKNVVRPLLLVGEWRKRKKTKRFFELLWFWWDFDEILEKLANFNRFHAQRVILPKVPKKRTFMLKPVIWHFFGRNVIFNTIWKKKTFFWCETGPSTPRNGPHFGCPRSLCGPYKSSFRDLWRAYGEDPRNLAQTCVRPPIHGSPYLRLEIPYRRSAIHMPHLASYVPYMASYCRSMICYISDLRSNMPYMAAY